MSRQLTSFLLAAAAAVLLMSAARAEIVWSDDFTGQTDAAYPSRDFTGNSVNDYVGTTNPTFFTVSASDGGPAPSLTLNDPSTTAAGVMTVPMSQFGSFSTANPATPILQVSFDFRIDSFLATNALESYRFVLRANGSNAAGSQAVILFNRGNLNDGDASALDLAFAIASASGTSNFTPSDATAIGLIPGVGWQPGFDFGEYSTVTSTDNDTDDLFYRIGFTYDVISGLLNGSITRIATDSTNGQSAPFSLALNPNLDFSNTDATDVFILATGGTTTGIGRFDNFVFNAVPEPSSVTALLLGLGLLGSRRRRSG